MSRSRRRAQEKAVHALWLATGSRELVRDLMKKEIGRPLKCPHCDGKRFAPQPALPERFHGFKVTSRQRLRCPLCAGEGRLTPRMVIFDSTPTTKSLTPLAKAMNEAIANLYLGKGQQAFGTSLSALVRAKK